MGKVGPNYIYNWYNIYDCCLGFALDHFWTPWILPMAYLMALAAAILGYSLCSCVDTVVKESLRIVLWSQIAPPYHSIVESL